MDVILQGVQPWGGLPWRALRKAAVVFGRHRAQMWRIPKPYLGRHTLSRIIFLHHDAHAGISAFGN